MSVNGVDSRNNSVSHRSLVGVTVQGGIFGAAVGAALKAFSGVDQNIFVNKGLAMYTERMDQLSKEIKGLEEDLAKTTDEATKTTKTKALDSAKNRLNFYKSKTVQKDASIRENIVNKLKTAVNNLKNKKLEQNYSDDIANEIKHIAKKAKPIGIFKEAVTLSIWCAGISLASELIMRGFMSRNAKKSNKD